MVVYLAIVDVGWDNFFVLVFIDLFISWCEELKGKFVKEIGVACLTKTEGFWWWCQSRRVCFSIIFRFSTAIGFYVLPG